MHIWTLKTPKLLGPLSRPQTPGHNGAHFARATTLHYVHKFHGSGPGPPHQILDPHLILRLCNSDLWQPFSLSVWLIRNNKKIRHWKTFCFVLFLIWSVEAIGLPSSYSSILQMWLRPCCEIFQFSVSSSHWISCSVLFPAFMVTVCFY